MFFAFNGWVEETGEIVHAIIQLFIDLFTSAFRLEAELNFISELDFILTIAKSENSFILAWVAWHNHIHEDGKFNIDVINI